MRSRERGKWAVPKIVRLRLLQPVELPVHPRKEDGFNSLGEQNVKVAVDDLKYLT